MRLHLDGEHCRRVELANFPTTRSPSRSVPGQQDRRRTRYSPLPLHRLPSPRNKSSSPPAPGETDKPPEMRVGRQASHGSVEATPGMDEARSSRAPEQVGVGAAIDNTDSAARQGPPQGGRAQGGAIEAFADVSRSVGIYCAPTPGSVSPALFHGELSVTQHSWGVYELCITE